MAEVLKHKFFCDKCTKSRYGDISFCSFDKHRDYTNHLSIAKHKRKCELIEKDENSVLCKVCNEKFSVEGYEAHKKRNERLWKLKKYIGNNLKSNENKSIQEKESLVEKEETEWVDTSLKPSLPMCYLCKRYENDNNEYKPSHLIKWDMKICDCVEED